MIRNARKGHKFVGAATGSGGEGAGELFEVYFVYEVPIMATFTPIEPEEIEFHPDWRD